METKLGNRVIIDRQKAWVLILKIGKPVSKYMKVCSLHLTDNDYSYRGANCSKRRNLKKIAVPSRKLPLQKYEAEQSTSKIEVGRRERIGKRNALKENSRKIQHFFFIK